MSDFSRLNLFLRCRRKITAFAGKKIYPKKQHPRQNSCYTPYWGFTSTRPRVTTESDVSFISRGGWQKKWMFLLSPAAGDTRSECFFYLPRRGTKEVNVSFISRRGWHKKWMILLSPAAGDNRIGCFFYLPPRETKETSDSFNFRRGR
jgi:hypothetical protein